MTKAPAAEESAETKFFFELTPERILQAVEASGIRCTGRVLPLNSMENRVYEVEIDVVDESAIKSPSERFRVVKFYRPGRWSKEQILEEHRFLRDLSDAEVPVVAPLPFASGETLHACPGVNIWYTVYPKMAGRIPDEFSDDDLAQLGRLLARLHATGTKRVAEHRIALTPETYGLQNLEYLLRHDVLPPDYRAKYEQVVREICTAITPWFEGIKKQRVHGDLHIGNLLSRPSGPILVDFDDMVVGPPVQDLWLILPGRDEDALRQREILVSAYEQMWDFDRSTLRLIEPLRALRFVHYATWVAKRWTDPAFPRAFPQFGSDRYWGEQVNDLYEQLAIIQATDEASVSEY